MLPRFDLAGRYVRKTVSAIISWERCSMRTCSDDSFPPVEEEGVQTLEISCATTRELPAPLAVNLVGASLSS